MMKQRPTGDLQYVQRMNRRLILETLLNQGPMSKIDISRTTTLSPTTVGNAITELQSENLVQEVGKVASPLGRRPTLLDIQWNSRSAIGLAVVDNKVVGIRTNVAASIQKASIHEFSVDRDITKIFQMVIEELLSGVDATTVIGIGLATPGVLDRQLGEIETIANFPWRHLKFPGSILKDRAIPSFIENDTNAAALGEAYFGRGRQMNSFCYVHVGTGVGAGVIVDRHIMLGSRGYAGEIGHMTVDRHGTKCRCGNSGCLEAYVSWRAIAEFLKDEAVHPRYKDLENVIDRGGFLKAVYESGRKNEVFANVADMLSTGIAALISMVDPEMVIVEGIYEKCDHFMKQVEEQTHFRLTNIVHDKPKIVTGELGEFASVAGIIAMILERNGFLRSQESLLASPYDFQVAQIQEYAVAMQ